MCAQFFFSDAAAQRLMEILQQTLPVANSVAGTIILIFLQMNIHDRTRSSAPNAPVQHSLPLQTEKRPVPAAGSGIRIEQPRHTALRPNRKDQVE